MVELIIAEPPLSMLHCLYCRLESRLWLLDEFGELNRQPVEFAYPQSCEL